jgi:hypothetical protein
MITGLTTTRNTRIQSQSQREGERIAREHGQLDKHLELRRAAYTELLHAVTELSECCGSILNAPAADSSDDLRDALAAARQAAYIVKRRTIVVALEGPPPVAETAGKCSTDAISYLQAILLVYQSSTAPPSDATVRDIVGDRCDQKVEAANSSYAAFIRAARETLGGHL